MGAFVLLSTDEREASEANGGQQPSILCDALESLIGAIYLDGGLEARPRLCPARGAGRFSSNSPTRRKLQEQAARILAELGATATPATWFTPRRGLTTTKSSASKCASPASAWVGARGGARRRRNRWRPRTPSKVWTCSNGPCLARRRYGCELWRVTTWASIRCSPPPRPKARCWRFYGWDPPAVSCGWNQQPEREANVEACRALGIDLVRRPTGGRAVLHWEELTYSVACVAEALVAGGGIEATHRKIGACLAEGLRLFGGFRRAGKGWPLHWGLAVGSLFWQHGALGAQVRAAQAGRQCSAALRTPLAATRVDLARPGARAPTATYEN